MSVFSTLVPRSNENKSCMRIGSYQSNERKLFHQNLNQLKDVDESVRESMRSSGQTRATLVQLSFDRGFRTSTSTIREPCLA